MSVRCASFDRKLTVSHKATTKSPNVFNLSVATFYCICHKFEENYYLFVINENAVRLSSFSSKTFMSFPSVFLSFLCFLGYNDTDECSYFSSFGILYILK